MVKIYSEHVTSTIFFLALQNVCMLIPAHDNALPNVENHNPSPTETDCMNVYGFILDHFPYFAKV
jgi:hypothetical protein